MFGSDEWGVPKVEVAQRWMVYKGKSQSKMDDDWGYPYFRKHPCSQTIVFVRNGTLSLFGNAFGILVGMF